MKVRFNSHIVDSWVPRYGLQSAPPHTHTDKARNHLFSDGWPGGVTVYPPNKTSETTDLYTLGMMTATIVIRMMKKLIILKIIRCRPV